MRWYMFTVGNLQGWVHAPNHDAGLEIVNRWLQSFYPADCVPKITSFVGSRKPRGDRIVKDTENVYYFRR